MTGATMPNPTATLNATAASTATSFGRSPNTLTRSRCIGVTLPPPADPQPGSYPRRLPVPPAACPQIVAHHVVAKLVIGRREDASAVSLGQLVDEIDEALVVGEHEHVER